MSRPAFSLRIYFVMPSYLRWNGRSRLDARARRFVSAWALMALVGLILATTASRPGLQAAALSLVAQGAGFLVWAGSEPLLALAGLLISAGLFAAAVLAWFATGNVLAPPIAWLAALIGAATAGFGLLDARAPVLPATGVALTLAALAALAGSALAAIRPASRTHAHPVPWTPPAAAGPANKQPELSLEDWQRIRLLLDRALQPVDRFDGFEWRDQFQTAAVRYQLNFLSYALSLVQAPCLPALHGCLLEAQRRLRAKQSDPHIWRYWRWENLWGN